MQKGESWNLTEKVYQKLYEQIIKFTLSPGSPLSDFALGKELGMSRTPIREALLKLVDDGLVEKTPKGFFVASITADDVRDLYNAREAIETSLLALAMERGIPSRALMDLRSLNGNLRASVEKGDILKALEYDNQIHEKLAFLGGNKRLKLFYDKIAKQVARMMFFSVAQSDQHAADEHEQVFKAIEQNDATSACNYLRQNISKAKKQHIDVLEHKLKDGWMGIVRFIYQNQ